MTAAILSLTGVTKRYGETVAVADVSLALQAGEVLALIGENGAGKSTIVKMIAGEILPDAGQLALAGRAVQMTSPRIALAQGIAVVHQHYALVPDFTVAENFALGGTGAGRLDRQALRDRVRALAAAAGIEIDPDAMVGSLDVAGQQKVEILKALSRDPRILILDEPAAVLPPEDAERLFQTIARIRAQGVAVALVTHRLADVFRACDRVAVMRTGHLVADGPVADFDRDQLVSLMICGQRDGAGVEAPAVTAHRPAVDGAAALSVAGLELRRANGSVAMRDMGFQLRGGEILAVAGVDGNGQTELVRVLAGLDPAPAGTITLAGPDRPALLNAPLALREAGLAHVPEDRVQDGIVPAQSLSANLLLSHLKSPRFFRRGVIRREALRRATAQAIADYGIRTTGPDQPIGRLSGGNQQKLVLARELLDAPGIVLAAHPSRGLDLRTIAFVQTLLIQHRARGAAILLVSADLDEIWAVADRVLVMSNATMRGPVPLRDTTRQEVGRWMAGH